MLPFNSRSRAPAYDLEEVQRLAGQGPISCKVTEVALDGGRALGFNYDGVIEVVLAIQETDFYKSMPSVQVFGLWQDVYRLSYEGVSLYVKLQINHRGEAVVIQFKER
jgi:motility quorum-sensing regulator/GCU-specific mRNA interferase toxin